MLGGEGSLEVEVFRDVVWGVGCKGSDRRRDWNGKAPAATHGGAAVDGVARGVGHDGQYLLPEGTRNFGVGTAKFPTRVARGAPVGPWSWATPVGPWS